MRYEVEVKKTVNDELGLVVLEGGSYKPRSYTDYFSPATTGQLLLHDLNEHSLVQKGTNAEDELIAIGVTYLTKYLSAYYFKDRRRHCELEDLISDVTEVILVVDSGESSITPRHNRVLYDRNDTLEDINTIVSKAAHSARENCDIKLSIAEKDNIRAWLYKGYVYAKERFRRYEVGKLADKFANIEEQLNSDLFRELEYPGQRFILNINFHKEKVDWKYKYHNDFY